MTAQPHAIVCTRSPDAFAHYECLVRADNALPIQVDTAFDLTEAEDTWDRLTAFEAVAFGIEPRLLHALMWAHVRYEDMIGVCDIAFGGFQEEERAAFPECFFGDRVYSIDAAIAFMVEACFLPQTQATLWVCRSRVQYVRSGLFEDVFNAAPWALGYLEEPVASHG